jgi:hypothetical protein
MGSAGAAMRRLRLNAQPFNGNVRSAPLAMPIIGP